LILNFVIDSKSEIMDTLISMLASIGAKKRLTKILGQAFY